MATISSIKQKISNLISTANATTGQSDTTVTDAVNTLISGYGQGGSTIPSNTIIHDFTGFITYSYRNTSVLKSKYWTMSVPIPSNFVGTITINNQKVSQFISSASYASECFYNAMVSAAPPWGINGYNGGLIYANPNYTTITRNSNISTYSIISVSAYSSTTTGSVRYEMYLGKLDIHGQTSVSTVWMRVQNSVCSMMTDWALASNNSFASAFTVLGYTYFSNTLANLIGATNIRQLNINLSYGNYTRYPSIYLDNLDEIYNGGFNVFTTTPNLSILSLSFIGIGPSYSSYICRLPRTIRNLCLTYDNITQLGTCADIYDSPLVTNLSLDNLAIKLSSNTSTTIRSFTISTALTNTWINSALYLIGPVTPFVYNTTSINGLSSWRFLANPNFRIYVDYYNYSRLKSYFTSNGALSNTYSWLYSYYGFSVSQILSFSAGSSRLPPFLLDWSSSN